MKGALGLLGIYYCPCGGTVRPDRTGVPKCRSCGQIYGAVPVS